MRYIILIGLLFFQNASAQTRIDWENDFLLGKVKRKIESTYSYGNFRGTQLRDYDSSGHITTIIDRDELGLIISLSKKNTTKDSSITDWYQYPDTVNSTRYIERYNIHGQIISSQDYYGTSKCRYNKAGNRIELESNFNNGQSTLVITKFDNHGNCIEEKKINQFGDTIILYSQKIEYNAAGQILTSTGGDNIRHLKYDSRGNVILELNYDKTMRLISETSYKHDARNKILEEKTLNANKVTEVVKMHSYDSIGNMVSSKYINSEGEFFRKEILYQYY
jgi:YD repeat-containing protein